MGMDRLPEPLKGKEFCKISGNAVHWQMRDGSFQAAFFGRPRFAEALGYNLSPFTYLTKAAQYRVWRFSPMGALGAFLIALFPKSIMLAATTTDFYSAANDSTYTYYSKNGGTWANCVDSTGTDVNYYSAPRTTFTVGCNKNGTYWQNGRIFFTIDTSSIGSGSTITAAAYSLVANDYANGDSISFHLCSTSLTSHTGTSDYNKSNYGRASSWGSKAASSWSAGAGTRASIDMNGTGLSGLSKTGNSYIAMVNSLDIAESAPAGINTMEFRSIDYTGSTSDPYLTVTYSAQKSAPAFPLFV